MTKSWGGYGKITRQLGNIENNTRFFKKKFMFQLVISLYGSRLPDFWYEAQKRQKKPREIRVSKAGTMWRFGGISNRYTSRKIYGRTILSTWHLSGSHDAHSPMLATRISQFMARWQRTPAALFVCCICERDGKINLNEIYR
jgi:hypothetical protein